MKKFALIGVAGYIAPKHLKAIKDTGNELVACLDRSDSVGILDSYFPDARFFTEFERFDRHLEKIRRTQDRVEFVSICSPNYLHDAHVRAALKVNADAICEKPLVINPWNLDQLALIEQESARKVYGILQLREHPSIKSLHEKYSKLKTDQKISVKLTYVTRRGRWYLNSWKGDEVKSGGVVMNIGIHFFDMLIWVFGKVQESKVLLYEPQKASGILELEKANVEWFLSTDENDLPVSCKKSGKPAFRSIMVGDQEMDFTDGFTDLHTVVYKNILNGQGYGIEAARPAIELVHRIRHAKPSAVVGSTFHTKKAG